MNHMKIDQLNQLIKDETYFVNDLLAEINRVIVGQEHLVEAVLIGLLADGHILLEGVPGLAKTLLVKTVAQATHANFARIQFTPDLLPADLIGTQIYNPQTSSFSVHQGPIFTNLVLADEINRAPAKVQSALLEAMQERQITIANNTYGLDDLFLVMATQNPIEQEGTYPLPEAQVDRFMLKVLVDYPAHDDELAMLKRMTSSQSVKTVPVVSPEQILRAREHVKRIYIDERIMTYVLDLVSATRSPAKYGMRDMRTLIAYGASPRAGIFMIEAARAHAFLRGRAFVTPDDVKRIAPDVLRHRVSLTYEAEAESITADNLVQEIMSEVEIP